MTLNSVLGFVAIYFVIVAFIPVYPLDETYRMEDNPELIDNYKKYDVRYIEQVKAGLIFVLIKGGCFTVGSPSGEQGRFSNENRKSVCVKDFYLSAYETTELQYRKCVLEGVCQKPDIYGKCVYGISGKEKHPINCVSWFNAVKYAQWLSAVTGSNYRLPTEAEWEYAARAGTTTRFYWGDDPDFSQACTYGNVYDKSSKRENGYTWENANCDDGFAHTAPIGSFKPNAFGLYDMSGNTWEWTCSNFEKTYAGAESVCNTNENMSDNTFRVQRGGSWRYKPNDVRSANRGRGRPFIRGDSDGFRLAETR